jgi:biopolymer transport protein ExbD
MLHRICQCCRWHEASCLLDKSALTLEKAVKRLLAKVQRQYSYAVVVVGIDSERRYAWVLKVLQDLSIVVEPRSE